MNRRDLQLIAGLRFDLLELEKCLVEDRSCGESGRGILVILREAIRDINELKSRLEEQSISK